MVYSRYFPIYMFIFLFAAEEQSYLAHSTRSKAQTKKRHKLQDATAKHIEH